MNRQLALEIAQIMLAAKRVAGDVLTQNLIAEVVTEVSKLLRVQSDAAEQLWLTEELERRFKVFVGKGMILEDRSDHIDWLPARTKEIHWSFWPRYRTYLARSVAYESVGRLDELTDEILGRLENPLRPGGWTRRGLVVGHVQSGKTANYVGLITKSADTGYKVLIVLAGIHNSLRAQTQIRLEEGFVGYGQEGNPLQGGPRFQVGAGLLDASPIANCATSRANNGDFSTAAANNFGIQPGDRPLLFVVKKNARVLKNILDWVETYRVEDPETGRRLIRDVPLLVIDDEADQASIDTNPLSIDSQRLPDPNHDPTRINSLVRRILYSFQKSAYVGYTATPFANIFIHHQAETKEEGPDLFPRSFIVNLPAPSDYVGPTHLFPAPDQQSVDFEMGKPPSQLRFIDDHQGWMPDKHRLDHKPLVEGRAEVPPSLREAIRMFVLACAARFERGHRREHKSMLVHVSRFTAVQTQIHEQVRTELASLKRRWALAGAETEAELKSLWSREFDPTHTTPNQRSLVAPPWAGVREHISDVLDLLEVRMINNTSRDVLAYQERRDTGFHVIAVGGDKLSRGLTLEGLMVSYFLRASRMYDTLMQMGRWFGYRPNYEDLCRLYLTEELAEWFESITMAAEELRQEFDRMDSMNQTPLDYGLRVRAHSVMMVTSQLKMRNGESLQLSFSGDLLETVAFHKSTQIASNNEAALATFLRSVGKPERSPVRNRSAGRTQRWANTLLWSDVPGQTVQEFLAAYKTHDANRKVRTELLVPFIQKQAERGELVLWSVALMSKASEDSVVFAGNTLPVSTRSLRTGTIADGSDRLQIRRLLSGRDEAIDLDATQWESALELTHREWSGDPGRGQNEAPPDEPGGKQIRAVRPQRQGLLLLYPLLLRDATGQALDYTVLGLGVSFPESPNAPRVTYHVNGLYYEQEYGPDE